jgi:hypothetical protein
MRKSCRAEHGAAKRRQGDFDDQLFRHALPELKATKIGSDIQAYLSASDPALHERIARRIKKRFRE